MKIFTDFAEIGAGQETVRHFLDLVVPQGLSNVSV
jgi:hypothetical protein